MRHKRIAAFVIPSLVSLALLILAFAPETGRAARPGTVMPASGDGIWQTIDKSAISVAELRVPAGSPYQAFRLNKDALVQQLARAPMEFTGDLRNSPAILSLPMPNGSFQRFLIEESPVMDA